MPRTYPGNGEKIPGGLTRRSKGGSGTNWVAPSAQVRGKFSRATRLKNKGKENFKRQLSLPYVPGRIKKNSMLPQENLVFPICIVHLEQTSPIIKPLADDIDGFGVHLGLQDFRENLRILHRRNGRPLQTYPGISNLIYFKFVTIKDTLAVFTNIHLINKSFKYQPVKLSGLFWHYHCNSK